MKDNKKDNEEIKLDDVEIAETEEVLLDDAVGDVEEDVVDDIYEELVAENMKLKSDYLRAFADSENVKKRCIQEIEKNNKYAISSFAKGLLGVADNLHRAISSVAEENKASCESLLQGVELTENELTNVLGKFNISKMDIMGKVFDPNFQQVIQEVEDKTTPTGTIIAELQTGYMINDRILREAMVVVTKGGC